MPFKHHAARRHRIPRARYRVMNWPAYQAGLRRRGDVTFWLDEAADTTQAPNLLRQVEGRLASVTADGAYDGEPVDRASAARQWQRLTGHGRRNQAGTAVGRCKSLIGPRLRARSPPAQQGETALAVAVLNRMIRVAKPVTVRRN